MVSSLAPYIAKDYFLWKEIKRQAELGYIKASICTNWQLVKPRALHSTQLATAGQSLAPRQGGIGHRPSAQKPEPRSHPRAAFSAARNWSYLTYSSLQSFPKNILPFTWGTVMDRGLASNPQMQRQKCFSSHCNCFGIQHGYFISTKAWSLPGIQINTKCLWLSIP